MPAIQSWFTYLLFNIFPPVESDLSLFPTQHSPTVAKTDLAISVAIARTHTLWPTLWPTL